MIDIQVQAPAGTPQLTIRLRQERLAPLGLTPRAVLETVQTAYEGTRVGQVYEGNRVVDVVAVLSPAERRAPAQVESLPLRSASARRVHTRVAVPCNATN